MVECVVMMPPWFDTTQVSASLTWLTDVPRICRTPSITSCMPGIPVSERSPPEVLIGSSPPAATRPPSTHLPPSPFRQKP